MDSSHQDTTIRIALVEDDTAVREGLKQLICGTSGYECVGLYANGEDALQDIQEKQPDVVLMDIHLPGISGIECIRLLKKQKFISPIIMLTVFEDDEQIFNSLTAGAAGYILKKTPPAKLLEAINDVYRGGSPMSSQIARRVVDFFQKSAMAVPEERQLSQREEEILSYLVKGYRYKEIAGQLCISLETVRTHIRNIYEKLQVHSRSEAMLKYYGHTPNNPSIG
jgi:DNA-binding NarL/FixJ family response regulator